MISLENVQRVVLFVIEYIYNLDVVRVGAI